MRSINIKTTKGNVRLTLYDAEYKILERGLTAKNADEKNEQIWKFIDRLVLQAKVQGVELDREELFTTLALTALKNPLPNESKSMRSMRRQTLSATINKFILSCSSDMKMILGCVSNLAIYMSLESIGMVRKSPRNNKEVRHEYLRVMKEIKQWNSNLLYGRNQWFSLKKMPEHTRRHYGDITDADYYDFWTALGGYAAERLRDELNVLQNKYKLSMESHGVRDAEMMASLMVAMSLYDCAEIVYESTVGEFVRTSANLIDKQRARMIWSDFCTSRIKKAWERALLTLSGDDKWELSEQENRNIMLTIEQIVEKLGKPQLFFQVTLDCTEDYDDIFKTKGMHKKVLREIAEQMQELLK